MPQPTSCDTLFFIFFLIFLSSFYTIRKKCVNDSLMNFPLLLRSASFFHPDDTSCDTLFFIFFLIFLSSFYTIRKKCVNDSLMNFPLLLRSASFFHPDDTICNLHCRLSVGYENNGLIFLLFFKHF